MRNAFNRRSEKEKILNDHVETVRDRHFSTTNNAELIAFCKGTGLRREGVENVKGKDLMSRQEINAEIARIETIRAEKRTDAEKTMLTICKDAQAFTAPSHEYFIHTKEKVVENDFPIIGDHSQQIIERFKATAPDEKVWEHVSQNADIHSYRAEYATQMYKMYARKIDQIPYDRINKGTGKAYQSEVYNCRKDEAGKKLDRRAMELCSKALGHNRVEVVANNYIRGCDIMAFWNRNNDDTGTENVKITRERYEELEKPVNSFAVCKKKLKMESD